MNKDIIRGFYQFEEKNPKTNELVYMYLIITEKENGEIVYNINDDYEQAKKTLLTYCRQEGYKTKEQLKANTKDFGVQLSNEQMRKICVEKGIYSQYQMDDETFNFHFPNKVRKEITEEDIEDILSDNKIKATSSTVNLDEKKVDDEQAIIDEEEPVEEEQVESKGIFSKIKSKLKRIGVKGAIAITTLAVAIGGMGSCLNRKNKNDGKTVSFKALEVNAKEGNTEGKKEFDENTADYATLLAHTTNQTKKAFFGKMHDFLNYFNGDFANRHSDYDKDTKLCLSTEEVTALYLAYNGKNLTNEQLASIFDNTQLDTATLIENYKSGYLQLMLASIVQTESTKLDMLIENEEGKQFYQKYEQMVLSFNLAETEQEKQEIAKNFVDMTVEDFKLNDDGLGFEHEKVTKDYYSAVLPMIAAMYNKTLSYGEGQTFTETQIEQLNAEALCDVANQNIQSAVDRLTMYQIAHPNQEITDPTHDNFVRAIVEELTKDGNYHLDNRDISSLNIYKDAIPNGHIEEQIEIGISKSDYTSSEKISSSSTTTSHSETKQSTVTRQEAVNAVGEETVRKAEDKANEEIRNINAQNKAQAEAEADKKQQEMQAEEDAKGEKIDQIIQKEEEKLQQDLDNINNAIDNNESVTIPEDSKIDLDDRFENADGTINGSISNITTTPPADLEPEPFPDLNNPNSTETTPSNPKYDIIEEEVSVGNRLQKAIDNVIDDYISSYEEVPVIQENSTVKTK